jgi:plastocyanin
MNTTFLNLASAVTVERMKWGLTMPTTVAALLIAMVARPDEKSGTLTAAAELATLKGTITFQGDVPKSTTADDAGLQRDLLTVDPKTRGLKGVVVWLVPSKTNAAAATDIKSELALMDQRDHEFVPRVLAVRTGQPVKFTNSDPANHNVRTSSAERTNEFNVFTGNDGSYTHRFAAQAEHRPIRVGCDIHPWMGAWIYVFSHPLFSVTDEQGRFEIPQIPPGDYQLHIAQPDIRYSDQEKIVIRGGDSHTFQRVIEQDKSKRP